MNKKVYEAVANRADGSCEVTKILTKKGEIILIDTEDVGKIKGYTWYRIGRYIGTQKKKKSILIHSLIMESSEGKVIDHINRNTLDNRKINLRVCTQSENLINTCLRTNNKSGIRGVKYYKAYDKWTAYITFNKINHFLGYFKLKEDAMAAREKAEKVYFTLEVCNG